MTAAALSTLSPADRIEGSGFYNLARDVASSVGISVVNALLTRSTQASHADIARYVTAVNRGFESPAIAEARNPFTAGGLAALDAMVTRQAQILAYIDDYKFLWSRRSP